MTLKWPLITPSHHRVTETINVTAIIRVRNLTNVNIKLTPNQTPVKINRIKWIKRKWKKINKMTKQDPNSEDNDFDTHVFTLRGNDVIIHDQDNTMIAILETSL